MNNILLVSDSGQDMISSLLNTFQEWIFIPSLATYSIEAGYLLHLPCCLLVK